jgi:hypothetical protein
VTRPRPSPRTQQGCAGAGPLAPRFPALPALFRPPAPPGSRAWPGGKDRSCPHPLHFRPTSSTVPL